MQKRDCLMYMGYIQGGIQGVYMRLSGIVSIEHLYHQVGQSLCRLRTITMGNRHWRVTAWMDILVVNLCCQ